MPDNTPFFIVGAGRSGTTLLRLILSAHTRLYILPETWFILDLVKELPLNEALSPAQVKRATDTMTADYRWPDMDMDPEVLRDRAAKLAKPRLADILDLVYLEHLSRAGKSRFGDKTPTYIQIVPQLATIYPGARFIHLIRDGRDVAISRIRLGWERYYERTKFEWTLAMDKRREYAVSAYAGQILEVRYEQLVDHLEATVQQICSFLGEQFEPAMLRWQHLTTLIPDRERHIHGKIAEPVTTATVAGWRHTLNAIECFAMEACLYHDLAQLGYPLRFSNPLWRPLLNITRTAMCGTAPWLARGVSALKRRNLLPKGAHL
jgi:Sulfotransferase family